MSNDADQASPGHSLGRNDRCHCGSGKKYKQCCLPADSAALAAERAKQAEARAAELAAEAEAQGEADAQDERHRDHRDRGQGRKADTHGAAGAQKRTLPRKVGS